VTFPYANVGHSDSYNSTRRYYLYIDLSGLPSNAKVVGADLFIDRVSSTWDQDGQYQLHWVKGEWETNSLTWNNRPEVSDSFVSGSHTQYGLYKFEVGKWVRKALANPKKYHGFMLRKPDESGNNSGLFATSDYSTAGRETRPYLVVNYYLRGRK
jgi:hypothetical protein